MRPSRSSDCETDDRRPVEDVIPLRSGGAEFAHCLRQVDVTCGFVAGLEGFIVLKVCLPASIVVANDAYCARLRSAARPRPVVGEMQDSLPSGRLGCAFGAARGLAPPLALVHVGAGVL